MTIPTLGDMASDSPELPAQLMAFVLQRQNLSVHQLFEAQVERTPTAIAVMCEDQYLTYHELNRRANRLAHYLRTLGVGQEMLVGLCVDRSVDLVVGLLGILKSGGAYVPIDPDYPPERFAFILEDTRSSVLVTQRHLSAKLPAHSARLVLLDSDEPLWAQQDDFNPMNEVRGEHLAYVIYTSGSTGQPKGVLIEHQALAAHCQAVMQIYELRAEDSVLQFSTFTFDASLEQILPTLLVGARLVMRGREIWSSVELLRKVKEFGLTVMDLSPAYLHLVLEDWTQTSEQLLGHQLRLMIVGGDRLLPEILELWPRLPLQSVRLLNAYGPTETIITATLLEVTTADSQLVEKISIGRPLPQRTTSILDDTGSPVPIGVAGELYIGGDLLARGYLNRPDLTAERFLADPFSRYPGARFYKTGDRARYLSDGTIEFLGRVDHQVKIRGFRIELGEIETVICQHPAVRQVVVVCEDKSGAASLVAYVVFHKEQPAVVNDLKNHVLQRLPDYMLPSAFVLLEALPLTTSGKVDRRALPAPEARRSEVQDLFVAPTLPLHHQLVQIWEELLDVRPIGVEDNFFDLGGHSLLAARLFDRIEQVCGKRLPISILHTGATIEYLAAVLMGEAEGNTQGPVISIHTGGTRLPFFYLHGQINNNSAFHCYALAQVLGRDQPFYGVKTYSLQDNQQCLPALEEMARAQLKAIRAIQPEGPYLLGGCCNGGLIAYEMARQLEDAGQTVALLLLLDPAFLEYPLALSMYHVAFERVSRLLRLDPAQQLNWELRLKHLARTLFFALLRRKDPDQVAFDDLSQNYFRLYDWIALSYRPSSRYSGKITFFWAKEGNEARKYRESWKAIEANCDTEIHLIPGNHVTCRTDYLSVLAEHLKDCMP